MNLASMNCNKSKDEKEWVKCIVKRIQESMLDFDENNAIKVAASKHLYYANEIVGYQYNEAEEVNFLQNPLPPDRRQRHYETDILIYEIKKEIEQIIPRIIIEAKLRTVHTHDAITYSQKASSHKTVHPYLRYGILVGDQRDGKLQGLLYRHGANFDFMVSLNNLEPEIKIWEDFIKLIKKEIETSRMLENIIYKKSDFSIVHRELKFI